METPRCVSFVVELILRVYEHISGMDQLLQMSIIEVIRLDCQDDSHWVSGLELDLHGALMTSFFRGSRRGISVVSLSC
jgi:hypothetical protein